MQSLNKQEEKEKLAALLPDGKGRPPPCHLQSNLDIFGTVVSFLSDPRDLMNVALCSKTAFSVVSERCDPIVSMEESIYGPSGHGSKLFNEGGRSKYTILMPGMAGLVLKKIALIDTSRLVKFVKRRPSLNAIAIAHCYGIDSSIFECLGNMRFIAVCDCKYEYKVNLENKMSTALIERNDTKRFKNAEVVILSNTVFRSIPSLRRFLKEFLPIKSNQMKLLGLGGCQIEDNSETDNYYVESSSSSSSASSSGGEASGGGVEGHRDESDDGILSNESFFVDVTFLTKEIIDKIKIYFPNSVCFNTLEDLIETLESICNSCKLTDAMKYAISSAKNQSSETCLHICKDIARVEWLLGYMHSDVERKDKHGNSCLQRYIIDNRVDCVENILTHLSFENRRREDLISASLSSPSQSQLKHPQSHQDIKVVRTISRILLMKTHWSDSTLYYSCLKGRRDISRAILAALAPLFRINIKDIESMRQALYDYHRSSASPAPLVSKMKRSVNVDELMPFWKEMCNLVGVNFSNTLLKRFKMSTLKPSFSATFQDVLFCDGQGFSPLHAACIAKDGATKEMLIEAGFSLDFPNESMQTPRDIDTRGDARKGDSKSVD